MATKESLAAEVNNELLDKSNNHVSNSPEVFIPLGDLHARGFLPWKRTRTYQLIAAGTLPPPLRYGPKLVGYTLTQIADIQRRLMVLR